MAPGKERGGGGRPKRDVARRGRDDPRRAAGAPERSRRGQDRDRRADAAGRERADAARKRGGDAGRKRADAAGRERADAARKRGGDAGRKRTDAAGRERADAAGRERADTGRKRGDGAGREREGGAGRKRQGGASGFGPYAGRSQDFEGGRGRETAPTRGGQKERRPPEPVVRKVAREAVARAAGPRGSDLRVVKGERADLAEDHTPRPRRSRRSTGTPRRLAAAPGPTGPRPSRLNEALGKAARALERGYEQEVLQILRPLKDQYPTDPDVRELLGLALYRLGRWLPARKELEAFVELTGSAAEHPVVMDCARALGRHTVVARLWEELKEASPDPEIMTEGRIVAAGSLADQGRITEAVKLLERGPVTPKRWAEHHLRLWYALADLYERAGDLPAARALFRKISAKDPAFFDVPDRLAVLS